MSRLAELRADTTGRLILGTALEVLKRSPVSELTVRKVARLSGISERTIFRYYPDRETFLDAIAAEAKRQMAVPPHPRTLEELLAWPAALYSRFEAVAPIVKASLQQEIADRIRATESPERWAAIRRVLDREFPRAPARLRHYTTANIRFVLGASTWHYYREYFGFSLADSIASAELAIRQALEALREKKRRG